MKARVVFGPPGTGKTRTLVRQAEAHAERGQKVIFVSFSNAAADEALRRVKSDLIQASTLHSLAFRALGISRVQVVDKVKLRSFGEKIGIAFKQWPDDDNEEGDDYLQILSFANNTLQSLEQCYDGMGRPGTPERWQSFTQGYADWKAAFGYLDFDDMLRGVLQANPSDVYRAPCIMLDEAQDCSPLQWKVFRHIYGNSKWAYIAGDDDQAIFEWSGANPHGMVEFAEQENAEVKVLAQSHRIPRQVYNLACDNLLSYIDRRVVKEFEPEARDGEILKYGATADVSVKHIVDESPSTLLLVRDRYRLKINEQILKEERVPYRINGAPHASPYTSQLGEAVRGLRKLQAGESPGRLAEAEVRALGKLAPKFEVMEAKRSRLSKVFPTMPLHLHDFYEAADMLSPVKLALSTVHQAKGHEAHTVICDLELTDRVKEQASTNPDAEIRVWYVAVTRTKERLLLCGQNPWL